jgi:hypothetical protein
LLDEKGLRRDDFVDGTPVMLADGQSWVIPTVDFWWQMVGGQACERCSLGEEYHALTNKFSDDNSNEMTLAERGARELEIAAWLLRRNYRLEPNHFAELLRFSYPVGDDDTRPYVLLRENMMRLAFGQTLRNGSE